MTFETNAGKPKSPPHRSGIPDQPEQRHDKLCKDSRSCRHLGRSFHDCYPYELRAAQLDRAVREGHAVTTELGANASAITYWVSGSDGWHVVTTVDTVIEQNGDAESTPWCVSRRCFCLASPS